MREQLAERIRKHGAKAWLVNTGWSRGPYGTGARISLKHTRAIIDAIHSGELTTAETTEEPIFGMSVPTQCSGVPSEILMPRNTWKDPDAYDRTAMKLAELFDTNFEKYESGANDEVKAAGPRLTKA